jgi:hypothetical protein
MTSSTFLVAGDWHGETEWAQQIIRFASQRNTSTLVQLGDFGIWPEAGGPKYVRKVNLACEKNDVDLIVVPGNHENYDRLDKLEIDSNGWMVNPEWSRIKFAQRGHVWQLPNGMWAAALGGGGSIDRNLRVEGKTWWAAEAITMGNVESLMSNLTAAGDPQIDVMFTHECPAGVYRPSKGHAVWITSEVEYYCYQQRIILREAVDRVNPSSLYHGHWHDWFEDIIEGANSYTSAEYITQVYGLTMNGMTNGHVVEVGWDSARRLPETEKINLS